MASWWRKNDPRSEYGGKGVLKNTLFPKGSDALTASDKLRLDSLTGQTIDPLAEPNLYHWLGNIDPGNLTSEEKQALLRDQALPDGYPRGY